MLPAPTVCAHHDCRHIPIHHPGKLAIMTGPFASGKTKYILTALMRAAESSSEPLLMLDAEEDGDGYDPLRRRAEKLKTPIPYNLNILPLEHDLPNDAERLFEALTSAVEHHQIVVLDGAGACLPAFRQSQRRPHLWTELKAALQTGASTLIIIGRNVAPAQKADLPRVVRREADIWISPQPPTQTQWGLSMIAPWMR